MKSKLLQKNIERGENGNFGYAKISISVCHSLEKGNPVFSAFLFWIATFAFAMTVFICLPNTASAGSISLPPNNLGLVGYWSFEDATGTKATDFSGNGNVGTLTNMDANTDWVTGKIGKALDFDGTNDYMTVADNNNLDFETNQAMSVTAWVYLPAGSSPAIIVGKTTPTEGWNTQGWRMQANASTGVLDMVYEEGTTYFGRRMGGMVVDRWAFVAMSYDGSGVYTNINFYVDGQLLTSEVSNWNSPSITTGNADALTISRHHSISGDSYFTGKVDELRIYSRALSATEISNLYNRKSKFIKIKSSIPTNNLVGYWSFEGIRDTSIDDYSSNGNVGTMTNMDASTDYVNGSRDNSTALDFDGTDDYVSIPSTATLRPGSSSYSVSMWMKPPNSDQNVNVFTNRSTAEPYSQVSINIAGGTDPHSPTAGKKIMFNYIQHAGSVAPPGSERSGYTNNDIADGTWHHVVFVADSSANTVYIYVDGVLEDVTMVYTQGTWPDITNTNAFYLGGYPGNNAYAGLLDDIFVYKRAISQSEISYLYNQSKLTHVNSSQNDKLTNGLVGLWSFDGPDISGTTLYDRSGNANNGTLTGSPSLIAGRIGQGMSFDGVNDYANITSADSIKNTSTFSASVWINPDSISITEKFSGIVGKGGYGLNSGWELVLNRDNTGPSAIGALGFVVKQTDVYTSTVLSVGRWYHVVVTFDGSTKRIYLNGVLDNSEVGGSFTADDQLVYIGVRNPAEYHFGYFEGDMDDVRVYNRALSTSEIQMLYNMGR